MTIRNAAFLVGLVAAALPACSSPPAEPTVDLEAETAALRQAADAYHEAAERGDLDAYSELVTSDVLLVPPSSPTEEGMEAARAMFSGFTDLPEFQIRFETDRVEVAPGGQMGYTLANAVMSYRGEGDETVEDRLRDFHVWKKEDGTWKVAVDLWSSELPPAAEESTEDP